MAVNPAPGVRHREKPRVTANDLAKFMVSQEPGRIGIIRRSRDSTTPPRARYSELRSGITGYLSDQTRNRRTLDALGNALNQRANDASVSNFSRQDATYSLMALDVFQRSMANQLAGFTFEAAPARQRKLILAGVEVSVHLDLLNRRKVATGEEVGGVLLRLTKADEDETEGAAGKRREMGLFAATLVRMQIASVVATTATYKPHPDLCLAVDVQCGDVHPAPRNFAQKAQRLEAACRFIAALWDTA